MFCRVKSPTPDDVIESWWFDDTISLDGSDCFIVEDVAETIDVISISSEDEENSVSAMEEADKTPNNILTTSTPHAPKKIDECLTMNNFDDAEEDSDALLWSCGQYLSYSP